jgi:hypothetical protein
VDEESEVASTTGCDATTIDYDTAGTTVTCSATSAGGTETQWVMIMRDATNPTVTVTGVVGGMTYAPWNVPAPACSTSDGMSGIAQGATLSLTGGPTGDITASCLGALDNAGNGGSASVTYTVVDPNAATEALVADIEQLEADGVLKTGQANGLIRPLDNALRSLDRDQPEDACNQLADFVVKVEAKVPPLTVEQASELVASAEAIRDMLGCE